MRLRNLFTLLFLFATSAFAQVSYVPITATVTDPSTHPLAGATVIATLVMSNGIPINGLATPNGQLFNGSPVRGTLDTNGYISLNLVPNALLSLPNGRPISTGWLIQISAPQDTAIVTYAGNWNASYQMTVTNAQDISATLSSLITSSVSYINLKTGQSTLAGSSGLPINNPTYTGTLNGPNIFSKTFGGVRYASQWTNGPGNNGILNAMGANQTVVADPSYASTEQYSFQSMIPNVPSASHFIDYRNGQQTDLFHDWNSAGTNLGTGTNAKVIGCLADGFLTAVFVDYYCLHSQYNSSVPGFSFGNPPYGPQNWLVTKLHDVVLLSNGSGIVQGTSELIYHYGVGDTNAHYLYTNGEGGWNAFSDEGTIGQGNNVSEDPYTFQGTISTGGAANSTALKLTNGTLSTTNKCQNIASKDCALGTGRYLIDITKGATAATATGTAAGLGPATAVTVSGATLPVSNAWGTQAANCGPANNSQAVPTAPFSASYTCSMNVTSGTFDTTHLMCFSSQFYECAVPTAAGSVVGGVQSVTIPLRKPHSSGGVVMQGGLAGYGLEYTGMTQSGNGGQSLRYLFDVLGTTSSSVLQAQMSKQGSIQGVILSTTGAVNLWPIAEVIDVQNEALTPPIVDGTVGLAPNVVQWANADSVEEVHSISGHFIGGTDYVTSYNPYAYNNVHGFGFLGPGSVLGNGGNSSTTSNSVLRLSNSQPDSFYVDGGGSALPPDMVNLSGNYSVGFLFDHGPSLSPANNAIIRVVSPAEQNNNASYFYYLWRFEGTGTSYLAFNPHSGNIALSATGTASYSASSHSFTGTVNLASGGTSLTPATSDNSTSIATTAYVKAQAAGIVSSGSGNALPMYGATAGTTLQPSNITSDPAGNNLNVPGKLGVGASSPSAACGGAVGCEANSEGATAGTPTAGVDYRRADSATHTYLCSLNGGAEAPCNGTGLGNKQFSSGTTAINPLTCTAETTITWSGLLTTSSISSPVATGTDPTTVTGWGPGGTLYFSIRVIAAGSAGWRVCNSSSSATVTPGAAITWNIGAQ